MTDQKVYQWSLSTAWDISTNKNDSKSFDYSDIIASGVEVCMDADPSVGAIIIGADPTGATTTVLYQWSLYSPGEMDTASLDGSFDATATIDQYHGISWADNLAGNKAGGRFYTLGTIGGAFIWQSWNAPSQFDILGENGRGAINMDGILYVIIQGGLYEITAGGTPLIKGDIASGAADMSTDGTNLVITVGATKYKYTVAGGLVEITDGDLGDAFTSAYLDSRFYYDQPSGQFVASALNDPTAIDALDFGTAESLDDDLLAVFSHNQLVYMCGERSIEIWFTTGVDRPPIDRQKVIQRGIVGNSAIDSNDNMIYFLDDTRRPNQMFGLDYKQIFTPALGEEFDSYTVFSDCIVNCYTWDQENFAEFYFPTQDITWTFHENSGNWFKNEDTSNAAARPAFYAEAYNKLLGLDRTNGKIYNFSGSTYQDDGSAITRTIDSGIITSEIWGAPGLDLILNEVNITAQSTGAATVSISLSTNLTTFGSARTITLAAGINRLSLYTWGEFREGIVRLTTTSNAKVDLVELTGDAELLRA